MSAMTASERRQQIARLLSASQAPISATTLSQELGVSRQIIVGDIALLRAAGQEITATARGYVIPAQNGLLRRIACIHSAEETRDELDAMVDCGCTVVDVIVEHPVYGQLTAPLVNSPAGKKHAAFCRRCRPMPSSTKFLASTLILSHISKVSQSHFTAIFAYTAQIVKSFPQNPP